MKYLTLTCNTCYQAKRFHGRTRPEVYKAIDKSGWYDGNTVTYCPKCKPETDLIIDHAPVESNGFHTREGKR